MDKYIFSGKDPLQEEVMSCLEARPSLLKAHDMGTELYRR